MSYISLYDNAVSKLGGVCFCSILSDTVLCLFSRKNPPNWRIILICLGPCVHRLYSKTTFSKATHHKKRCYLAEYLCV